MNLQQVLTETHRGEVAAEINTALAQCIAAVKEHGVASGMTLKIVVKPIAFDQVHLYTEVTTKLPHRKARPALYFMTEDNQLTRDDPGQGMLPMGDDKAPPQNVTEMPRAVAS